MAVNFANKTLLISNDGYVLQSSAGDFLCISQWEKANWEKMNLSIDFIRYVLQQSFVLPKIRLSVLNPDETLNYVIPPEDIVKDGVNFTENHTNGQRRSLSIKLINIKDTKTGFRSVYNKQNNTIEKQPWSKEYYKYAPNVGGLWFGTKILYEEGFEYQGQDYYFVRGIFIINNFDLQHNNSSKDISYQLTDKYGLFDGNTGVLESGYEIPVGTPIDEAIDGLLNLSCSDGYINDQKVCIIDSKYANFVTQATIRVDEGGKIADIYDQLATQMSAEHYYNTVGNLVFYPIDESMNDINKPIVWTYNELQMNGIRLQAEEEIVNVVKVTGTNVDNKIYTAVAKNTNLSSPINIYYTKERRMAPIDNANVLSDDMAQELADYHLRQKTILTLKQSTEVVYNPLLMVNNIIEIENNDLNMKREKYIINSISYTSGSATMTIEVTNLNNLPIIGGLQV